MSLLPGPSTGSGFLDERKQRSRKGKKAWRKNVDVTDIEKGLQDLNEEIVRGGVIKEKLSPELFSIDLKTQSTLAGKTGKREKLKADEIISQRSAIPFVPSLKRSWDQSTRGSLPTTRQQQRWIPHKDLARLRRVANGYRSELMVPDVTYDVWNVADKQRLERSNDHPGLCQEPKKPKSMLRDPLSLTMSGTPVAAIQIPSSGYSYNPSFADYERRLIREGDKVLEAEQRRLADETTGKQREEAVARSAAEADAAEERADVCDQDESSGRESIYGKVEIDQQLSKLPKRKTQAQRNRMKRRKETERLDKQAAALKARQAQEQRIMEIAREAKEREQLPAVPVRQTSSSDADGEGQLRRRQIGKVKLPMKQLELVLPDELQDSLRRLKPESNLLTDRYRNMLIRGRTESRRRISFKRQSHMKLTEKWTYKDFTP